MKREDMLVHIRRLYDARLSNNVEEILPLFASAGSFRISCHESGSLFPPAVASEEGRRTVLENLVSNWEWLKLEDRNAIVDENCAAVHYILHARNLVSGEEINCEMLDKVTLNEEGKVIEFIEFFDTGYVASLAQS